MHGFIMLVSLFVAVVAFAVWDKVRAREASRRDASPVDAGSSPAVRSNVGGVGND